MIEPDSSLPIRFLPGDLPELPELGPPPEDAADGPPRGEEALMFLEEKCRWKPIGDIL